MEILELYIQTLLDALSIFLISIKFSDKKIRLNKNNILWIFIFHIIIFIGRLDFLLDYTKTYVNINFVNYDILPVKSLVGIILLVLFLLVLNSSFFKLDNKETIFSVVIIFITFIVVRVSILSLLNIFSLNTLSLYSYLYRILTLILCFIIYLVLPLNDLKYHLKERDLFTKSLFIYSFLILILLISYSNFNVDILLKNPLVVIVIFLSIIVLNLWIIYVTRGKAKQEKRIEVSEQYLPIINELVMDIKSKQHEFNNKLLGILSIIETSNDLETLKYEVREYTNVGRMERDVIEVLNIEDKVLGGFLYYKIKTANFKGISLKPIVNGSLHNYKLENYEIIEIAGILIDNAIESSKAGEEIKVIIESKDNKIEIQVINPFKYISNEDFINMFELGYSTKSKHVNTRGYGLYNVKRVVDRYKGKLITKNSTIDGKNYITIGIVIN